MAVRQGWVILARDCAVPLRFVQVVQRQVGASAAGRDPDRRDARPRRAHLAVSAAPPGETLSGPHLVIDNVGDPAGHVSFVIDWFTQPHS